MIFTNDELNLMCIYDTGTRTGLIEALSTMREQLEADETELLQMTDSAIKKLRAMSDEDYEAMELFPDFNEEDIDAEYMPLSIPKLFSTSRVMRTVKLRWTSTQRSSIINPNSFRLL